MSSALRLNNFESVKVVQNEFVICTEYCCQISPIHGGLDRYPYNPTFAPYAVTEKNISNYSYEFTTENYGLIKWIKDGATTFTIINFSTREMRDYQYKTKGPHKFHLIPFLNAVAINSSPISLREVILLKDGTSLMGESLNGVKAYRVGSEYFYNNNTGKAVNLFTLIDDKMEDLGSIEFKDRISHCYGFYVEPGVCAFALDEDNSGSKSLTLNRYAYNATSKKFSATTPILINLGLEKDETAFFSQEWVDLWHLSTDKAKATFEFMLGFGIDKPGSSTVQAYTTVKINDSGVVGSPAPLLRGVQAVGKNTLFYEDDAKVTEIFKRKDTAPSA